MSSAALRITAQRDWSHLIMFARAGAIGVTAVVVAGALIVSGTFLPGDLPHLDTPDTLPGPAQITQTTSPSSISLADLIGKRH